jgi:hypothetical protein
MYLRLSLWNVPTKPRLKIRPESFDGLSVDCAYYVLPPSMINDGVWIFAVKLFVSGQLISAEQANFVGDGFSHKCVERHRSDVRDHARDHITLAADRSDDRCLTGTYTTRATAATALISVPVFGQAADERFVNFDNAAELIDILHERDADAMAHIPSRFQGTKPHITPNLARAYSLFAGEHQMNDAIPVTERFIGVFEDRASQMRETICASLAAMRAFPMPFPGLEVISPFAPAARTADAIRPTLTNEVSTTGVFVWKHRLELGDGHLMDLRWLFCSRHNDLPYVGKIVA